MQKEKRKKIVNITVNVVVSIILIVVFILSIMILASAKKGYTSIFGTASVAVETSSMDGDKPDSFKKGDLIRIKILKTREEKSTLEIGQIITFYDQKGGQEILNTHRIIRKSYASNGEVHGYATKGDNPLATPDLKIRDIDSIIGICTGKTVGLGNVILFFKSSIGFVVCVLIPAILIACYCIYLVARSAMSMKAKKEEIDEKELMRREILKEMGIDPDSETGRLMVAAAATKFEAAGDASTTQSPVDTMSSTSSEVLSQADHNTSSTAVEVTTEESVSLPEDTVKKTNKSEGTKHKVK